MTAMTPMLDELHIAAFEEPDRLLYRALRGSGWCPCAADEHYHATPEAAVRCTRRALGQAAAGTARVPPGASDTTCSGVSVMVPVMQESR